MTYRLMIVDDEDHIREGLGDLVDWEAMGFEVAAKLEDGREALEWLQKTEIDVILTDNKMTHVSGLDLAKYVHEHKRKTKIILLSGYREFDFVKEAIGYNVVNYLLKPTKIKDIVSVFQELKQRLDEEKEEQRLLASVIQKNNELLPVLRKHLFRDLVEGRWKHAEDIDRLFRLTGLSADLLHRRCALIHLGFDPEDHASADSIEHMIGTESDSILYVPLTARQDGLYLIALELEPRPDSPSFAEAATACLETVVSRASAVLGIVAVPKVDRVFANLEELVRQRKSRSFTELDTMEPPPIHRSIRNDPKLSEARKQFLGYVNAGNAEALPEQFEQVVRAAREANLPIPLAQNMLIELFSTLCSKLSELDLHIEKITDKPFFYEEIIRLRSYEEMKPWGKSLLDAVAEYAGRKASSEPTLVQHVKDYVQRHYHEDISLETAAAQVYLSPDYFGRVFKQQTGSNFTDYVAEIRINKALEFLRDPKFKVYEIGSSVGYKNPKYFFKLFKKYTGFTPNEYRRKSINKELRP